MAIAPPGSRLQGMLQAAVQSVKWTYSLYWQICPQQGILIWGDGYYNGPIKTRKTVQPIEVSAEEASLQRSQQLRELYDSLSADETTQQSVRRPCAALSPEDLTETEWFYLMCVSFSFSPGIDIPGKAYSRRQHVWLTGANEADSKTFSRAILAKSAHIQTVVCVPLSDGVVELGTTEKVLEDVGLARHVKSFFTDHRAILPPPKPAPSEQSTSNPAAGSTFGHPASFYSQQPGPSNAYTVAPADPLTSVGHRMVGDEEEEDEDDEDEAESDSEAETGRAANRQQLAVYRNPGVGVGLAGPTDQSELIQLEMSEDIRLGSPNDGSENLGTDFHTLSVHQPAGTLLTPSEHQRRMDSFRAESSRRWQITQDAMRSSGLNIGLPQQLDERLQEDAHYSQTISAVLHSQQSRRADMSSTIGYLPSSTQSAFSRWMTRANHLVHIPIDGTSQWLLKYILFSVPFLHNKYRDENSPKSGDGESSTRLRKVTSQEELSANHVLAERRRREKLNERFVILRSLVPFVTKMDKASILGDTIEYVKQLRKKIQDLEAKNRQLEAEQKSTLGDSQKSSSGGGAVDRAASSSGFGAPAMEKRKMRIVEGSGIGAKPKAVEFTPPPPTPMETSVQVSIIESNGLIELQCHYKEGLLLDVMQMLRDLRIEITAVQSSLTNGFFVAELRAKVNENANGRRASIVEVKRAIQQLIPHIE